MSHEKRRFVSRVDYITSPGFGDGNGWRQRVGLPRGGPAAVITTLGLLRFDEITKEMILVSVHPGVSVQAVLENTDWPLRVAADISQTPAPTQAELTMLQRFDPKAYWTGD
jgi:glutaconate CoA-transferase subunit B